jgi:hypothetical protein
MFEGAIATGSSSSVDWRVVVSHSGHPGRRACYVRRDARASTSVSTALGSNRRLGPCFSSALRKAMSNPALCATSVADEG